MFALTVVTMRMSRMHKIISFFVVFVSFYVIIKSKLGFKFYGFKWEGWRFGD